MKFINFLLMTTLYFAVGLCVVSTIICFLIYLKLKKVDTVVSNVETTHIKCGSDTKNIIIKDNRVYCDGVFIKKIEW